MEEYLGYFLYLLSLLTVGGIYAIFALGLNVQWGFAGLFNVGIVGFAAVGAYTYALLTTAESTFHIGGFGWPLPLGMAMAMVTSTLVAAFIGFICIRLRSDYLAIATIGIAEIIKLILKNETDVTNGPRGINRIPRAWENFTEERFYSSWPMAWFAPPESWDAYFDSLPTWWWQPFFAATVLLVMYVIYRMLEAAWNSPWGRMMTAIRENESAARAAGKDVTKRRIEAFVIGAAIMGLGGALFAQHLKLIEPTQTFDSAKVTFLVWVMLIAGGSGNNRGAMLGAFLIWSIWSASELMIGGIIDLTGAIFGSFDTTVLETRAGFLRMMLIGILMQVILQKFPSGILPEVRPASPQAEKSMRSMGVTK